ncbi:MAG: DUF2283 domain-containing protein [Ardenticatenia bacterium]|nr:MAG: DUF2283 domain-containing protein [Ardenticatenia bacterium]
MKLKINRLEDTLYLRLHESDIAESEEIEPGLIVDFDAEGNIVGIEILQLSRRVPKEALAHVALELTGES